MPIRALLAAAALSLALAAPTAAHAVSISHSKVLVRYSSSSTHAERVAAERATGTGSGETLPGGVRTLHIEDGDSVSHTLAELRAQPGVEYAIPDYRLHAAALPPPFIPNDPGRGGPGDWQRLQWNFTGPFSLNAPQAWSLARQAGAPGGKGVTVAVIDSGTAYRNLGRYRQAPDLAGTKFVAPYDFVDHDKYPLDGDGHGTHVTGTIAQTTNNRLGVTGLAYGVKIMPVRVLDSNGDGDGSTFARAVRYAVKHHARVINMSVEFDPQLRAADIPDVISALRYAHKHGVVMVGATGNEGEQQVAYPAKYSRVIAVGATTADGCQAEYSNSGSGIDVMAPGGGTDADAAADSWDASHCDPTRRAREIYQQTFVSNVRKFRLVGVEGTSEAAPHVTALAALVLATKVIGSKPSPDAVAPRIESTARDIGPPGYDTRYGYGLVDAAAALTP